MKTLLAAFGVCLLFVVNASAQWATCTGAPVNSNGCNPASVGIGTATPSVQLDTYSASGQVVGGVQSGANQWSAIYAMSGGNGALFWDGSSAMRFGTSNALNPSIFTELMRIAPSGNIGIGTPAPATILHLMKAAPGALGPELRLENSGNAVGDISAMTFSDNSAARAQIRSTVESSPWQGTLEFLTGIYNPVERMRITGSGNVGVGTPTPTKKLQVAGSMSLNNDSSTIGLNNAYFLYDGGAPGWNGYSYGVSLGFQNSRYRTMLFSPDAADVGIATHVAGTIPTSQASFTERLTVQGSTGNVGIGVTNPTYPLSVAGTIQTTVGVLFPDGIVQTTAYPFSTASNTSDLNRSVSGLLTSSVTNTSSLGSADLAAVSGNGIAYVRLASTAAPAKDWRIGIVDATGIFKIRDNTVSGIAGDLMTIVGSAIHFNGDVDGTTVHATYQDLAEWVPAAESMIAGTVVVVSNDGDNTVTASTHAYDTSVAGVVSPNPGLLLGVASESKAKIATTGRVRVRVDATKSPIHKGDLLVTSDRPGMAMKSEPIDIGGVKLHRPGTLIGKALEPLASGEGDILVLLSMQ